MYHVDITNSGDYSFKVKSNSYEFIVDAGGKGATPLDALLAGLGTCVGVYVRKYAEGTKLNLPEFNVSVGAYLSSEAPVRFKKIEIELDFKGTQLDEHKRKAITEFAKNCPAHNTLKHSPEIDIEIK